jgi:hypothetical protein
MHNGKKGTQVYAFFAFLNQMRLAFFLVIAKKGNVVLH